MGDKDEFKNFDPRRHWAKVNNESIPRHGIGIKEAENIEKIIQFLKEEKTMKEIGHNFFMPPQTILRYFTYLKEIKGVSVERTLSKSIFYYKIQDSRK